MYAHVRKRMNTWADELPLWAVLLLSVTGAKALGLVDYLSGPDFTVGVLYVLPVTFATWFAGRWAGHALALLCSAIWFYNVYLIMPWELVQHPFVIQLNFLAGLGILMVQVDLLYYLRAALKREAAAARTDFLTGCQTSRAFNGSAGALLERARRQASVCTFAVLDVDNFKQVNDTLGHEAGDRLLQKVVRVIRANVRSDDQVGRIGGDEFAMALENTGAEEARLALERVQVELARISGQAGWPVTFSVGLVTCEAPPPALRELLQEADRLMYEAKNGGKNALRQRVIQPAPLPAAGTRHEGDLQPAAIAAAAG